MKTFYLFPTFLALMIQMMMNSQNQRMLPVLGKTPGVTQTKPEKNLNSATPAENRRQETRNAEFSTVVDNPEKVDNNTFNYYNNQNCYATMLYANELLKQADELEMTCNDLRSRSKELKGVKKTKLQKELDQMQGQVYLKRIQASEISGSVSMIKFKKNESDIAKLSSNSLLKESIMETAMEINSEARHEMKIAKEFREEAYSVRNNAAKLGMMNNAEEKEFVALGKQDEAIALLKSTVALCENVFYDLAVK